MKYDKKTLLDMLNNNSVEVADGKRGKYKESDITDAMVNMFKKEVEQLKDKYPDTDFEIDDYDGESTDAFLNVLQDVGQIGGLNPLNEAKEEDSPKKKVTYTKSKMVKLMNDNSIEVLNGDREKYKSSDISKEMLDALNDGLADLQDEYPEVDFTVDDYEGEATDKFLRLLDKVGKDGGFNILDDTHEQRMKIKEMTTKFARHEYTPTNDISEMARYLEYLDYVVSEPHRNKFDVILDSYLSIHDPGGEKSIYAAAMAMNKQSLNDVISELKELALYGDNHQLGSFMSIKNELSKHLDDESIIGFETDWDNDVMPLVGSDEYLEAISKIDELSNKYNVNHINIGYLVPNELSIEIKKNKDGILHSDGRVGKTDAELNGDDGSPEGQVANEAYQLSGLMHMENASEVIKHPKINEINNWSMLVDHNAFRNGSDLYQYIVKNADHYQINIDEVHVVDNNINKNHYGLVIIFEDGAVNTMSGVMGLLSDAPVAFEYKAFTTLINENGIDVLVECSSMPDSNEIATYCKDIGGVYDTVTFNKNGVPHVSVLGADINRIKISENYKWVCEVREKIDGIRVGSDKGIFENVKLLVSRKFAGVYNDTDIKRLVVNEGLIVNDINASRLAGKLRIDTGYLLKTLNNGNIV
jgi:hypothetical protein